MNMPTLKRLYDSLTSKLGKETAEDLTNYIDNKITTTVDNKSQVLASKDDLLKQEIRLTDNFNARFDKLDAKFEARCDKLDERIDKLETRFDGKFNELKNEITDRHNNLMKWMFIFWVGQLVAIFGFLLLFLGK